MSHRYLSNYSPPMPALEIHIFTVDVGIGTILLPAVDVVGDDVGNEIIIGRNVLNRLRLGLDGPGQQIQVLGP